MDRTEEYADNFEQNNEKKVYFINFHKKSSLKEK